MCAQGCMYAFAVCMCMCIYMHVKVSIHICTGVCSLMYVRCMYVII